MDYPPATYNGSDDEDEYDNENGPIGGTVGGFKNAIGPDINNRDNQNRKVITLDPYDPNNHHRTVYTGMHFEGKCATPYCKVNGKMVWVPLGFGTMFYAEKLYESPCPICKVELKPDSILNIGYRYAKVKFVGRKSTGERVEFSDEEKSGKLIKFLGGNDGKSVEWVFLRM